MIKKNNISYILILLMVISCTSQHDKNYDLSQRPKNIYFSKQAELFFGNALFDKMSFSSFSSDKVTYVISSSEFSIDEFNIKKSSLLNKNSWIFYKRIHSSYIYCNGDDELEIIVPQSIYGNQKLHTGSTGMQLKNRWNILFSHPRNGTTYSCNTR